MVLHKLGTVQKLFEGREKGEGVGIFLFFILAKRRVVFLVLFVAGFCFVLFGVFLLLQCVFYFRLPLQEMGIKGALYHIQSFFSLITIN